MNDKYNEGDVLVQAVGRTDVSYKFFKVLKVMPAMLLLQRLVKVDVGNGVVATTVKDGEPFRRRAYDFKKWDGYPLVEGTKDLL